MYHERDHRNRQVSITDYDDGDVKLQKVTNRYDAFDRWIGKTVDTDGDGDVHRTEAYAYDGNQIVLRFAGNTSGSLAASSLANRYLWGPAVDQLLADEAVTSLTSAGTVDWALGDHLNTVRDWARYNSGTNTTTIADHAQYDATTTTAGCLPHSLTPSKENSSSR